MKLFPLIVDENEVFVPAVDEHEHSHKVTLSVILGEGCQLP